MITEAKKQIIKANRESLENGLLAQIRIYKLPKPTRQFKFHPTRRWKFDFAWIEKFIAVEVDGGTWSGGRHTTGVGFRNDCEKTNAAVSLGWSVYRFTSDQISSGYAIDFLRKIFLK